MTHLQRIRALLALAHQNNQEHERRAAWLKACSLMDKHGLGCDDFDQIAQRWCFNLAALFGGGPQRAQAGYSYAQQDARSRPKGAGQQGPERSTHVRQGDVERNVDDKQWSNCVCAYCGARFSYEAYPGNPRRYCSETCKEAKTRETAMYRARARRWRAKSSQ